ncbi:MAG TPA: hypothetical protein VFQ76_06195 [Longimicrobiaceae bacterium]|nr:hypothetical protein [Longimicrobiaceae bacterium]
MTAAGSRGAGSPESRRAAAVDLLDWAGSLPFTVADRSDPKPKRLRVTRETVASAAELRTDRIRASPGWRGPGDTAIRIEHIVLTAERGAYRALGLALFGYALSEQKAPLRIHLPRVEGQIEQIIVHPSSPSSLEIKLGFERSVREIRYRPRLPEGEPNYTTTEQDDEDYPREHLPYCRLGSCAENGSGHVRPEEPVCVHFKGTAPSLVWLGKFLLDLALEDNHCRLAYLYNSVPAESLAPGSAELRLVVASPDDGPVYFPPHES